MSNLLNQKNGLFSELTKIMILKATGKEVKAIHTLLKLALDIKVETEPSGLMSFDLDP